MSEEWRGGNIEPPADGGVPEHLRAHLARFAQGCEVCGTMDWRAKGVNKSGAVYGCYNCGNVFDVSVLSQTEEGK